MNIQGTRDLIQTMRDLRSDLAGLVEDGLLSREEAERWFDHEVERERPADDWL